MVKMLSFSPDDSKLASANFEDEIRIWDCNDWNLIKSFKAHDYVIRQIAWSPDGSRLASTSWDNTVKIWNSSNWELYITLTNHNNYTEGVSWHPNGLKLATGSWDDTLIIWNTLNWTESYIIQEDYTSNKLVQWNYNGKLLAVNSFSEMRIYDTDSWKIIDYLPGHSYGVFSFDWCDKDNRCSSGSFKNEIKIWKFDDTTNSFNLEKQLELAFD